MKYLCWICAWMMLAQYGGTQTKQAAPDTIVTSAADSVSTVLKQKPAAFRLRPENVLPRPTMPRLRISEEQKRMQFRMAPHRVYLPQPGEIDNYDALNPPATRGEYTLPSTYIPPLIPITPMNPTHDESFEPLPFYKYTIPTRQELDILEILWTKEDVMDTTIYSTLDSSARMTMKDLQLLLDEMTRKGFVSRKQVSPRFEFNAFGVLIEMSPTNRRNRVYEYRSKVDEKAMKRFIDANAFLYKENKNIVNMKQLQAARNDSTLLLDLNARIKGMK